LFRPCTACAQWLSKKSKVGLVKDTFSRALSVAHDVEAEEVASVPEDQQAELLPLPGVLRTFHHTRHRPGTYATFYTSGQAAMAAYISLLPRIVAPAVCVDDTCGLVSVG
jgi:uncharacterized membrane protein